MSKLNKIIENKVKEIERAKEVLPLKDLKKLVNALNYKHRNFAQALSGGDGIKLIAEVKKFSPSFGDLSINGFEPVEIAKQYERAGASAISVLTDYEFFGGKKQHLLQIKNSVKIPVLRKDFIIDEYQIYEAKYIGADAILLIVRLIDDVQLEDYLSIANEIGLEVLVEVFDRHDIARALKVSPYPKIIGINNRDLETFEVDISRSIELSQLFPPDVIKVSESGIKNRDDVLKLIDAGFNAILVGETLMKSRDKVKKIFELLGKN